MPSKPPTLRQNKCDNALQGSSSSSSSRFLQVCVFFEALRVHSSCSHLCCSHSGGAYTLAGIRCLSQCRCLRKCTPPEKNNLWPEAECTKRATSVPAEGPAHGLDFERHCEFPLRALQAQKWYDHRSRTFGVASVEHFLPRGFRGKAPIKGGVVFADAGTAVSYLRFREFQSRGWTIIGRWSLEVLKSIMKLMCLTSRL